jgi:sister chromatid cohesion protein DCC1
VLCTPNRSFQLRQVQTSNSLYVTSTTLHGPANDPATCAIALCATTLELSPADKSAVPNLQEALPVYDHVLADANRKSKASIFSDIPLSPEQCEQAWRSLLAFEQSGSSYRPSAQLASQTWQSINAAALAEDVTLDEQFLTADLVKLVEEEGRIASLATAILKHLSVGDENPQDQWSCLDRTKVVPWVGTKLLESKQKERGELTADFLDRWKDCLPEEWRTDAELTAIPNVFQLVGDNKIVFKDAQSAAATTNTSAPKASASARKWHEKFGKNRKK